MYCLSGELPCCQLPAYGRREEHASVSGSDSSRCAVRNCDSSRLRGPAIGVVGNVPSRQVVVDGEYFVAGTWGNPSGHRSWPNQKRHGDSSGRATPWYQKVLDVHSVTLHPGNGKTVPHRSDSRYSLISRNTSSNDGRRGTYLLHVSASRLASLGLGNRHRPWRRSALLPVWSPGREVRNVYSVTFLALRR